MKDKLKLLPSLRERKRYMVLLVLGSGESAKKKIENAIICFIGTLGYAQSNPMIIETGESKKGNYAMLSINRKFVDKVKSALALKSIKCIGVSGSVKKARRFL